MLVNFRIDPDVLQQRVPAPFRVRLVRGYAMAGICLIRLEGVRPARLPGRLGLGVGSDNAAYRIAVEWMGQLGDTVAGVFIPRRDTSSALQRALGGRLFPGEYHHSQFTIDNDGGHISVGIRSDDGLGDVRLEATESDAFPSDSVFASLAEASRFFEEGAIGYSARRDGGHFDGLRLTTDTWHVSPLHFSFAEATFFERGLGLPPGAATLDNALVMRDTGHDWVAEAPLSASPSNS